MAGAVLTGRALLLSGVPMGRYLAVIAFVLVLAFLGVVALFVVQNGARTTQLSLDLGFAAWQLKDPVAIPALVGITFGSGFFLGVVPMWLRGLSQGRKVKQLERQAALSTDRSERPW